MPIDGYNAVVQSLSRSWKSREEQLGKVRIPLPPPPQVLVYSMTYDACAEAVLYRVSWIFVPS